MNAFSLALAPILALILVGYVLKRLHFMADDAWAGIEKLTYYILFPALLIHTLGSQSFVSGEWLSILLVVAATLTTVALILILLYRLQKSDTSAATFTSIFQGGVRFNTYIALSVIQSLFAAEGLALGSIASGFMIILINLFCISVFAVWGKASFRGVLPFIRQVVANPLIVGCSIGWLLSLSGIGLPGLTADILEIIGRAALPFGLLAVGASLKPELIRGHFKAIIISSTAQFGIKPLLAVLFISVSGLNGVTASVIVIGFMVPTATSSYILARQLGGDAETMASIVTFQTLLAFIVMPLLASILLR